MYNKLLIISVIALTGFIQKIYAWNTPDIQCTGLPGCKSGWGWWWALPFVSNIIAQAIQYLAAIAVIALIVSGIMYVLSWGDEEKTKKAKNWIVWSIAGVVLSLSAWWIISILNNINVNLS